MTKKEQIRELNEAMNAKLIKLSKKYPDMCISYLVEMHEAIDWGEAQLKKIK